ncbi:dihydropteroate synthase [Granulicella arctica]|uniref:Dihydropteroate synthase n=1 Tax=Granulicella arctica TaxID=940613 RepID=A0A7Y9PFL7_9BACT|nr:dihydropteroate synthase [Granulicella arctica]NYF78794.1 dihydropteroate synthase [Granulicella arctica]
MPSAPCTVFAPRTPFDWRLRTRTLALGPRTRLMGILNITPDSFSDGGQHLSPKAALTQALTLLDQGADLLDLGGESTRPNATPLTSKEEQQRILPVLKAILKARPEAILSIDTFHAGTAKLAIEAGAEIVNDISGFTWDADMPSVCAALNCGVVLMHTRGRPHAWATQPPLTPTEVMPLILDGLRDSLLTAYAAGIPSDRIVLDPGFGFGKRGNENYTLHALLPQLHQFGLPILTGTSRKSFLAQTLAPLHNGNPASMDARLHATTASNVAAILAGAHILRIHDVRPAAEAAAIADAILTASHPQ